MTSEAPPPARPWISALLSVFMTGLGQVANGHVKRGLALYATTLGTSFVAAFLVARADLGLGGILAATPVLAGPYLYSIVDAWRGAKAPAPPGAPPRGQRIALIAALLVPMTFGPALIQAKILDVHRTQGEAMAPAFAHGAWSLIDRTRAGALPTRGEVVLVPVPQPAASGRAEPLVPRRVVGLPGETVEVRDDRVFVNELALDEPYATTGTAMARIGVRFTLREGQIFVISDNRGRGQDSRNWGPVAVERLAGRVRKLE